MVRTCKYMILENTFSVDDILNNSMNCWVVFLNLLKIDPLMITTVLLSSRTN